jgi:hypothetical protein
LQKMAVGETGASESVSPIERGRSSGGMGICSGHDSRK